MENPSSAVLVIGIFEAVALAAGTFLFGGSLIAPVYLTLVVLALALSGSGIRTTFVFAHVAFGIYYGTLLFADQFFFVNVIAGAVAVALIVQNVGGRNTTVEVAPE